MENAWIIFALGLAAGFAAAMLLARRQLPAARPADPPMTSSPSPSPSPEINRQVNVQRVLDALDEAVIVATADKTIVLANEACRRFFPSVPDILGHRLPAVLIDHRLDDAVTACLQDGEPRTVELRGGQTGSAHWLARIAPLSQGGGQSFVRILIHDETERAQTEQIRREFVANASHELRTPLTIVHGYIESLLDGALADPELARRFLKTSRRHTERMGRLIEDMLAVAKLESGDSDLLRIKPFSLAKCLVRVTEHLGALIEQRQATLTTEIHPAVSRFTGDRFYWEQILFNLIENALKNNPQPGLRIAVTARPGPDGGAILTIEDDGIGIPKAALPFIFKRFYRVQKDHNSEVPGTGLGLSIVKRAVEAHGGTIAVESQPGQRTTFTIQLPASAIQPSEAAGS